MGLVSSYAGCTVFMWWVQLSADTGFYVCTFSCVWIHSIEEQSVGWVSPRQRLAVFLHILGVTEHDRRVEWEHIIFLLLSPQVFNACVSVCTNVLSIGCSWVAKQPCVCMVEWGWKGRSTRSTETDTHKHYCVRLDTSVLLTNGCVNRVGVLKSGRPLPLQTVKSIHLYQWGSWEFTFWLAQ